MPVSEGDVAFIDDFLMSTMTRAAEPVWADLERREPRCRICRDETVRVLVNELLDWHGAPIILGRGKTHAVTYADVLRDLEPLNEGRDKRDRIGINGFHLEPRCRVCRNDVLRNKVNDMLATGASYAMIVRALAADNTKLDPRDRVTIDSIRNHSGRHFPVQNVAKATYREILERRAKANGVDFVEGVATAITPIAFFETVMVKSYETLVDSNTRVDVNTGIVAAGRLQSLIDSRDASRNIAELRFQLGKIGEAVKSTVPQEMWAAIVEKLEELEQDSQALDVGEDGFDDADDDPYDPTELIDEDDEF